MQSEVGMELVDFFIQTIGKNITTNKTCGVVICGGFSVSFWKSKKELNTYHLTKINEETNEAENFKLKFTLEGA